MIRNVLEYLEASAERCPDKMALQDENESLTYREYVTRAKTAATYLATHETKGFKNRPVAVIIDRNIRSITAFIGIVYSGNFYVPIDHTMPEERIRLIYDTLQPVAVVDARTDTSKPIEGAVTLEDMLAGSVDEELLG